MDFYQYYAGCTLEFSLFARTCPRQPWYTLGQICANVLPCVHGISITVEVPGFEFKRTGPQIGISELFDLVKVENLKKSSKNSENSDGKKSRNLKEIIKNS